MGRTPTATATVQHGRPRGCAGVSRYGGPRIRADRRSEALAPRTPSATPSGAARCELKTASGMTDGRGTLAQTAPSDANILHGHRVSEAARPGGHGRRGRLVPGHQSPRALLLLVGYDSRAWVSFALYEPIGTCIPQVQRLLFIETSTMDHA